MSKEEILKRFGEIDIIYKEPVTLRSGATAEFYCNIKKACGYPDVLIALADLIGEKLTKEETCLAVLGYGGMPLGAVIAARFNRKLITVRNEEKKYGPRGLIAGYAPDNGDVVVIIDDVLTTGNSIMHTLGPLEEIHAKISRAIVVVAREKPKLSIPYDYLFTIDNNAVFSTE